MEGGGEGGMDSEGGEAKEGGEGGSSKLAGGARTGCQNGRAGSRMYSVIAVSAIRHPHAVHAINMCRRCRWHVRTSIRTRPCTCQGLAPADGITSQRAEADGGRRLVG